MKILVTGGAGFIGSHLVDRLIEQGHKVLVVDNLSTGNRENVNKKAEFHGVDICDLEKIKPLFKGVDCVFHLAAIPRMPLSIEDPSGTTKANIQGTVNVLYGAKEAKVKRVVYASSSSVYGDQEKLPLKEDMVPNPVSPYGLQKLSGEQFCGLFFKLYGLETVCLRYFNVFGPRVDFDSDYSLVVGKFLRLRSEGKPLTIYGDGRQSRAFCYVDDVVEANIKAMEPKKVGKGEVINIGAEKPVSVEKIAQIIGGKVQHLPERSGDPKHTSADLSLGKELLSWSPETSFEEGVKRTREWFEGR